MEHREEFYHTLTILNDNMVLNHLILIGSWAEYLYEATELISDFYSTTKTTDIDFLIKNINLPRDSVDLVDIFEKNGYITDFSRNGLVSFAKKDFEVEFLARQVGKPIKSIKANSFGIEVEVLNNMDIITHNYQTVTLNDIQVNIPEPAAFVLHKMIINNERKDKKEKDAMAVKNLLFALEEHHEHSTRLKAIYNSLFSKQKKRVKAFAREYGLILDFIEE